jgi:hypothetical protein
MKSRFPTLVMISAALFVAPIHVIGQAQVSNGSRAAKGAPVTNSEVDAAPFVRRQAGFERVLVE